MSRARLDELLQKLTESDLWQKLGENPDEILLSLGVDPKSLSPQERIELGLDAGGEKLEPRESKSAWFGGTPFGR